MSGTNLRPLFHSSTPYRLFGLEGFMGINAVAFITAVCGCNAGVFAGVIADYGEPGDMVSFPMLNILSMPAIPVLVLAVAEGNMSSFNWINVITILVPFVLGIVMGNLDPKLAKLYETTTPTLLPFLGACFGSSINLVSAVRSGISGIVLALLVLVINAIVLVAADRLISHRPGYAAAAMCSVPGIAMSIGSFIGGMGYDQYLEAATAQIAFAVIVTSLLAPFVTKLVVGLWGSPQLLEAVHHENGVLDVRSTGPGTGLGFANSASSDASRRTHCGAEWKRLDA